MLYNTTSTYQLMFQFLQICASLFSTVQEQEN